MLPVFKVNEIWSTYCLHRWTVFVLKWYLDKGQIMVKLNSEFDKISNMQLKYGDTVTQK